MASSVPSSPQPDPYADRRVYPRVPVALPAFLQIGADRQAVQILDLSAGGAKLTCSACFSVGTEVTLDCGTFGREAVVRWQDGEVLGVCFETEIADREVSALIDRSKALAAWRKTRE